MFDKLKNKYRWFSHLVELESFNIYPLDSDSIKINCAIEISNPVYSKSFQIWIDLNEINFKFKSFKSINEIQLLISHSNVVKNAIENLIKSHPDYKIKILSPKLYETYLILNYDIIY